MSTRTRKRPARPHRDDVLNMVERFISGAENAGDELVELNIHLARFVLDLAKIAPKDRHRPPLSGREKIARSMLIAKARIRRAKLIKQGVPKGEASDQAASEASGSPEGKRHGLAASTVKRMMQHRR
jgi:hypothetical protein